MKEISDVADIRMYEEKAMYYKKNGVDRQGQPASYVALYRLYTQILRINLEKDCYKILNWEETKNKKKFVKITYRRKEGDGYKRITLEIIPEDENSQNTYEGFLYVKE